MAATTALNYLTAIMFVLESLPPTNVAFYCQNALPWSAEANATEIFSYEIALRAEEVSCAEAVGSTKTQSSSLSMT